LVRVGRREVELAMLQQELPSGWKPSGEAGDRLGDDARPGEADERARLAMITSPSIAKSL